jgi:uncharacterized RDD family membrane protein YckC
MEWLYFAILESSKWHATLGKRLMGVYVADANGKPVDFWRASRRFIGGRLLVHVPLVGVYYFLGDCACVGILPSKRRFTTRLRVALSCGNGWRALSYAESSAIRLLRQQLLNFLTRSNEFHFYG